VHDPRWDAVLERDLSETFDEADTLSTLNHPGIVKTLNRGFGDPARRKRPFMVLEYFDGVTLDALLKAKKALPVRDVLLIAQQIADAVHQAHQVGILHRDLKPGNVMVRFDEASQRWQVKVIDFGLAVRLHIARTNMGVPSGRRTALDRSLAGTIRYAPPEQRNELDADVGAYSDVYAFGKTCLDLLLGTTEPKSLHWKKLPDDYRDSVQDLLERATIDELEHRFSNFKPVMASLAGLLGESRSVGATFQEQRVAAEKVRTEHESSPAPTQAVGPSSPKGSLAPFAKPSTERGAPTAPATPVVKGHIPGTIMTVRIPAPDHGPKPGTLTGLNWKAVPIRPKPNK
jgi:serine/threonine protein kinase